MTFLQRYPTAHLNRFGVVLFSAAVLSLGSAARPASHANRGMLEAGRYRDIAILVRRNRAISNHDATGRLLAQLPCFARRICSISS
jgi:hypothetical protein